MKIWYKKFFILIDEWVLSLYTNNCVNRFVNYHVWGWCDWHWRSKAYNFNEEWLDKEHQFQNENNRKESIISIKIKCLQDSAIKK